MIKMMTMMLKFSIYVTIALFLLMAYLSVKLFREAVRLIDKKRGVQSRIGASMDARSARIESVKDAVAAKIKSKMAV